MLCAGDQIGNLQFRLEKGEIPKKQPKVAIVLIGTNDFFAVDICFGTEAALLGAVPGVNRRCCQAFLLRCRAAADWVLSLNACCKCTQI